MSGMVFRRIVRLQSQGAQWFLPSCAKTVCSQKKWKSHNTNFKLFWNIINKNVEFWLVSLCDWKPSRLVLEWPNELFCKIAVLQWVLRWENWSSFMSCLRDEIHLLRDFYKQFLWNRHYRRQASNIFSELSTIFKNLLKLWMFVTKRT